MKILVLPLLVLALGLTRCVAAGAPPTFADPAQRARYTALIAQIRCLVCQNQSLADSNAALAEDLRAVVQRMIGAGADDDQIVAFLVERYGDFVLYRPPLKPLTWLLWAGPLLLLLSGGAIAARLVYRRAGAPAVKLSDAQRAAAARIRRQRGGRYRSGAAVTHSPVRATTSWPFSRRCWPLALLLWACVAVADPERDMALANLAYERGDVVDAIARLRQAAEQGYPPAQVRLAYILDKSEQNTEALSWYQRAAEQGDPEGQYGLGQMYLTGEGGEKNLEQGRFWITRAAESGFAAAMRALVLNYERGGMGLPVDPEQALHWLRRAADQGDQWAIKRLRQTSSASE